MTYRTTNYRTLVATLRRENAAMREALKTSIPMLVRLGDFIGNGPENPRRPDSLGERCDLIGDIKDLLNATDGQE